MVKPILLPRANGQLVPYHLTEQVVQVPKATSFAARTAYAAVHVVANPLADVHPSSDCAIDWEATLAYRRHLWSMGFAVAEAMDTAQRGMGLHWSATKELMRRSVAEARALNATIVCGAGTDQIQNGVAGLNLGTVQEAYQEQCAFIESMGGRIILMASRALAAMAKGPEDYAKVYDAVLSQVSEPVILHWLGDMFDPALKGYWGHNGPAAAMDVCLDIIRRHAKKIEGIKISLLDAAFEVEMRRQLPGGVKMFTGDDFNYPDLILGDDLGYSHALLGIFDAIAPVAAAALHALDAGDIPRYQSLFAPTVPLSRHIFQAPTQFYKTGVVFLSYLNGHQTHFKMVGGLESMRSTLHLTETFVLADQAGLLIDKELACTRMKRFLALAGVV